MKVIIDKLIWAQWNVDHIWQKHSVSPDEVVVALQDPFVLVIPAKQGRLMVLGRAQERLLVTIVTDKGGGYYFVVTARDMSKKERALYRSQKGEKYASKKQ